MRNIRFVNWSIQYQLRGKQFQNVIEGNESNGTVENVKFVNLRVDNRCVSSDTNFIDKPMTRNIKFTCDESKGRKHKAPARRRMELTRRSKKKQIRNQRHFPRCQHASSHVCTPCSLKGKVSPFRCFTSVYSVCAFIPQLPLYSLKVLQFYGHFYTQTIGIGVLYSLNENIICKCIRVFN